MSQPKTPAEAAKAFIEEAVVRSELSDNYCYYNEKYGTIEVSFTGRSFSEALILASTKPQYDKRFFIELQVQYMKIASMNMGRTWAGHAQNMLYT